MTTQPPRPSPPWEILMPAVIWQPDVHKALLPLLAYAVAGGDKDCMEVIKLFVKTQIAGVAVEGQACSCCAEDGKRCIAPTKHYDRVGVALTYATGRCINCTLSGKNCDLPTRTYTPICLCDWLMRPLDRAWAKRWAVLGHMRAEQIGQPLAMRVAFNGEKLLPHLKKWSRNKLASAIVNLPPRELVEQINGVLGRSPFRDDGLWLVQPVEEWVPCACGVGICRSATHPKPTLTHECATEDYTEEDYSEDEATDFGYRGVDDGRLSLISDDIEVLEPVEEGLDVGAGEGRCCGML